ncbi:MAG: hypothetical protein EBU84_19440, partial [Actinobacteria bacterium]|nr:hypothetical protein [Actinomycetota bacterium]
MCVQSTPIGAQRIDADSAMRFCAIQSVNIRTKSRARIWQTYQYATDQDLTCRNSPRFLSADTQ